MIRCMALLFAMVGSAFAANTLVLPNDSNSDFTASLKSSWAMCDEQVWCANEMFYYRDSYIAEAQIIDQKLSIQLLAEYSSHLLSELQLNLRRDGFSLVNVSIEGAEFDVASEVEESSTEEADRELVLFLNRFSLSTTRKLHWQTKLWDAVVYSDGELVTVTFTQRNVNESQIAN